MNEHYRQGIGAALRHNQVAYAYSVMATASFGVLAKEVGAPDVPDCFLFVVGAGLGFAGVNLAVTRGFSRELADEPSRVIALANALSFFSTAAGLAVAALIGWLGSGWYPWLVGPLAATLVFIVGAGAEMGLAGWKHEAGGVERSAE